MVRGRPEISNLNPGPHQWARLERMQSKPQEAALLTTLADPFIAKWRVRLEHDSDWAKWVDEMSNEVDERILRAYALGRADEGVAHPLSRAPLARVWKAVRMLWTAMKTGPEADKYAESAIGKIIEGVDELEAQNVLDALDKMDSEGGA